MGRAGVVVATSWPGVFIRVPQSFRADKINTLHEYGFNTKNGYFIAYKYSAGSRTRTVADTHTHTYAVCSRTLR